MIFVMSQKKESGCYSKQNTTTIVGVLIIIALCLGHGCIYTIVSSVCQGVIAPTENSSESLVVIIAILLLYYLYVQYQGVIRNEFC